ncbi:MAG: hypothetical protein ABIN04_15285 [Ginsengibacter sp.]
MKPSEFYENYWKIDYGDGNMVAPPKLNKAEKDFLDNAVANPNWKGALFTRSMKQNIQVNIEVLKEQMSKFPEYFIPENQPKLDKYGQILDEEELNTIK